MIARWRRILAWERLAAMLAAGVASLAGWWLVLGALEGAGVRLSESSAASDWPLGLALLGLGQWLFIRVVADGVYPDAPIVLRRAARWTAAGVCCLGLAWLTAAMVGG